MEADPAPGVSANGLATPQAATATVTRLIGADDADFVVRRYHRLLRVHFNADRSDTEDDAADDADGQDETDDDDNDPQCTIVAQQLHPVPGHTGRVAQRLHVLRARPPRAGGAVTVEDGPSPAKQQQQPPSGGAVERRPHAAVPLFADKWLHAPVLERITMERVVVFVGSGGGTPAAAAAASSVPAVAAVSQQLLLCPPRPPLMPVRRWIRSGRRSAIRVCTWTW